MLWKFYDAAASTVEWPFLECINVHSLTSLINLKLAPQLHKQAPRMRPFVTAKSVAYEGPIVILQHGHSYNLVNESQSETPQKKRLSLWISSVDLHYTGDQLVIGNGASRLVVLRLLQASRQPIACSRKDDGASVGLSEGIA